MGFLKFLFHLFVRVAVAFGLIALIAYSLWWLLAKLLL